MGKKIVIVGGVAGGASVAARSRRLDESNEIVKSEEPINKIISFLKNFFYLHYGITDDDPYITTKNYAGEAPISQNVLKLLYSEAPVSSYGDMTKMETILNKEVRDAREITDFEVDENTIAMINKDFEEIVDKSPKEVRAKYFKHAVDIMNQRVGRIKYSRYLSIMHVAKVEVVKRHQKLFWKLIKN